MSVPRTSPKPPPWVMPVLAVVPLWALLYASVLEVRVVEAPDVLMFGGEVFAASCAACHGASGMGTVTAPALADGEVVETFRSPREHRSFVAAGSADGVAYGDPDRGGGRRIGTGGMPPWGRALSDAELAAVVCFERVVLGGADGERADCQADPDLSD